MKPFATRSIRLGSVLLASAVAFTSFTVLWADPPVAATAPAASAPASDAIAHYRKARDLFDAGKYEDAKVEVSQALQLAPDLQDAKLLASRIDAELARRPGGGTVTTAPVTGGVVAPSKDNLLTEEQIYRVRLFEMSEKDLPNMRGTIAPKAVEEFWTQIILKDPSETATSVEDHNRFVNPSNFVNQISKMRAAGITRFYDSIKLYSDPPRMIEYRKSIQPFLLQNCATAACHGGADAHGYRIYGLGHSPSDRETYTNFYMLATYSKSGVHMIDRDDPARSLLLQYGKDKKTAGTPHPNGIEIPAKLVETDDRYKNLINWIRDLTFPTPNYGIAYTPATAPATAPAPK